MNVENEPSASEQKEFAEKTLCDLEMCDFPRFIKKGWQIGFGPTEAMCKVLTYRLKGAGMRWDSHGTDAAMALIALQHSNSRKSCCDSRKQAA
jgi:hypothetical protein